MRETTYGTEEIGETPILDAAVSATPEPITEMPNRASANRFRKLALRGKSEASFIDRISLPRTETNAHKKTAEFPGKFDGVIFKSKLT